MSYKNRIPVSSKINNLKHYQGLPENQEWVKFLDECKRIAGKTDYVSIGQMNRKNYGKTRKRQKMERAWKETVKY